MRESKIWPKFNIIINSQCEPVFEQPEMFAKFVYPYIDKKMTLIVKKRVKDRSRQEEKYYWAVVVRMVAEEMGIGRQEAHEIMANLFLRVEEKNKDGIRYYKTLSTTDLSDQAYRDYWVKCVEWASKPTEDDGISQSSGLGLFIPLPNEVDYEFAI